MTSVLIVVRHPVISDALHSILELGGFKVAARESSARDAIARAGSLHPEIILVDSEMLLATGAEIIDSLLVASPGASVVLLADGEETAAITAMAGDRPIALVRKDGSAKSLISSLRAILAGSQQKPALDASPTAPSHRENQTPPSEPELEDSPAAVEPPPSRSIARASPPRPGLLGLGRSMVHIILTAGGLASVLAVTFLLLRGTLRPGLPENLSAATTGDYLSKVMLVNYGGWWTPNWYLGFDIDRWYAPLTTILTLLLGKLAGDYTLGYNLLAFSAYTLLGVGLFLWLREELDSTAAAIGCGFFLTGHAVFFSFQGLYWEVPRLFGLALLPWALMAFLRIAKTGSLGGAVGLGLCGGLIVLFNTLALLESLIAIAAYGFAYVLSSKERSHIAPRPLFLAVLVAGAISAWWLVPALSQGPGPFLRSDLAPFPMRAIVQIQGEPGDYAPYFLKLPSAAGFILVAAALWALWRTARGTRDRLSTFGLAFTGILIVMIFRSMAQSGRLTIGITLALAVLVAVGHKNLGRWWIRAVPASACLILILSTAFEDGSRVLVDQQRYRQTAEFRDIQRVGQLVKEDERVYIMWSDRIKFSEWFNYFFPSKAQVLGGNDQAPILMDVRRIDYLMKSAKSPEEGSELDALLARHGITYLAVDLAETTKLLPQKYEVTLADDPLTILRTGYKPATQPLDTGYWDLWRIGGVAAGLVLAYLAVCYALAYSSTEEIAEPEVAY